MCTAGLSQTCFSQPNCQGNIVQPGVVTTARGCCAGTDEGMSFNDGTECLVAQCIRKNFPHCVVYMCACHSTFSGLGLRLLIIA